MKNVFGIVLAVALAGCASAPVAPVRIDGSSAQACEASWKKMEASLNAEQRQQLDIAMLFIGATKQRRLGTLTTSPGIGPSSIREEIDGKDFEDIVDLGRATGMRITNVEHAR
jgi:hypothetical protein